jgi:hypothetical protein
VSKALYLRRLKTEGREGSGDINFLFESVEPIGGAAMKERQRDDLARHEP